MSAVQIVRDDFGRLVGVLGSPADVEPFLYANPSLAVEIAVGIAADVERLADYEAGYADLPAPVVAALDALIAERNAYNPLSKGAA